MKSHFMEMLLLNRCFILFYFFIIVSCIFKQIWFQAFYQKDMTVLSFCKQTLHLPWFLPSKGHRRGRGWGGGGPVPPPPPPGFATGKVRLCQTQVVDLIDHLVKIKLAP